MCCWGVLTLLSRGPVAAWFGEGWADILRVRVSMQLREESDIGSADLDLEPLRTPIRLLRIADFCHVERYRSLVVDLHVRTPSQC